MAAWVVYNPLASDGTCRSMAELLEVMLEDDEVLLFDITKITNYAAFLSGMEPEDRLILAGGDGTLNRFVNDTQGLELPENIFFFPCGTGNDFACDLGHRLHDDPFCVAQLLRPLPTVEVNGRRRCFVNAVGFGLDGYCCRRGDELRREGKAVNYTAIAAGGLLGRFRPVNAQVTVDGVSYSFRRVWIAPTMHGRYYGGGMMAAPAQDRQGNTLSLVVLHNTRRLPALCLFPGIFSGRHVQHRQHVTVLTGREITVRFDRPAPLQIDGETLLDVSVYTARAVQTTSQRQGTCKENKKLL